ncbi:MAG: DNA polymerase III subunit delta [Actinobacteria bacterium]|nr:DNA polymerase III subunit delta [Actinomycetota bacterium]
MADIPDKPVYLLTGSDRPKIDTALRRLRGHFVREATDLVSALDTSAEAAVALCNAGSLFGDARLVVVEDVDGRRDSDGRRKGGWKAADADALSRYLANPAPATVLALVGEAVGKTTALWKECAKAGSVLEFAVAKKALQGWITEQFAKRGVRAEPEACALLLQLVGEDLHALSQEVDKLATWAAGEPIGEREVEILCAASAEVPIFALTDAWAVGDSARALEASETIFERESKTRRDTAARLAAALGSHLSRLRLVKRLAGEGVRSKEAAGKLRMNPFYVQKLYGQADAFSPEELRDATVRLADLDGALKGKSRLAPDLEVQRALVELMHRGAKSPRTL